MTIEVQNFDAITFDCYGTLIDWDTGVSNFLSPWIVDVEFPGTVADLVAVFAKHQRAHQRQSPFKNYKIVLRDAMDAAVKEFGMTMASETLQSFANSVGTWPAFIDTVDSLRRMRSCGFHLGVVSNVDDHSFAASHERLGGLIDTVVTAEQTGVYKPDLRMFDALFQALERQGISRERTLHLAQSRFHDVAPGNEIGLNVVWIDRRYGRPGSGITIFDEARPIARFDNLEQFCETCLADPPLRANG